MDLSTITVAAFKARFYRDFKYSQQAAGFENKLPDPNFIQDQDITIAFGDAQLLLNQGLFSDDTTITAAYLLLTAHSLCLNIRASDGGGAQSGVENPGELPVNSRSVGSVSESYTIPEAYIKSPILSQYTTTTYGLKYLSMALPAMVGNMAAVRGGTNP